MDTGMLDKSRLAANIRGCSKNEMGKILVLPQPEPTFFSSKILDSNNNAEHHPSAVSIAR